MKRNFLITVFLFFSFGSYSQLPKISYPLPLRDSFCFINQMPAPVSFVMIFSKESYWWSNTDNYRLLSYNENTWTLWSYVRKWKSSSERYSETWPKKGRYFRKLKVINNDSVFELLDSLDRMNFWVLSDDSLNETKGERISDDVNYKFQVESPVGKKIISSYAPEYYLSIFPEMRERRVFLLACKYFEFWWTRNSR